MKCNTCGKMNCMAHGGKVEEDLHHSPAGGSANRAKGAARSRNEERQEGVNRSRGVYTPGESGMGYSVRGGHTEDAKKMAHQTIKESRNVAGGKTKRPLEGLAEGGEVDMDGDSDIDNELMDMVADELHEAIAKKDKKGMVEAIKAIVMSCKE